MLRRPFVKGIIIAGRKMTMSIGPLSEWVTATAEIVKMIKVYSIVQHIIEILNNDNIPHAKKERDVEQLLQYLN